MSSKLLRNGTVVSWDDASGGINILQDSSILIIKDEIAAITTNPAELDISDDTEVVDMTGKILTPGFVNCHCHMWQTAFRSMAPDIFIAQYFGWLSQMGTATASFSPQDIYISSLAGYCEGLSAGVTSYVDHASTNWRRDMIAPSYEAGVDSGARVWWCYDVNTHVPEKLSVEAQCESILDLVSKNKATDQLVTTGFAFDGFSLTTDAGVDKMKEVSTFVCLG